MSNFAANYERLILKGIMSEFMDYVGDLVAKEDIYDEMYSKYAVSKKFFSRIWTNLWKRKIILRGMGTECWFCPVIEDNNDEESFEIKFPWLKENEGSTTLLFIQDEGSWDIGWCDDLPNNTNWFTVWVRDQVEKELSECILKKR